MTRITDKELHTEENQSKILLQAGAVTRVTVDAAGGVTLPDSTGKLAFFGGSPVAVQSTQATTGTFAAAAGTAALSGSTWVGNSGATAYTVSDIVSALKQYGLLGA